MNGKKVLAGILCLVFLGTMLNVAVTANTPTVRTSASGGDRLYVAMQQDMPNFNYFDLGSNSVWKQNVIGWCFASLSGLDKDGTIFPAMAESWTFDEENLIVNVTLRDGIKFHDGTAMTVEDVIFSFEALREGVTVSAPLVDTFDADGNGHVSLAEIDNNIKKIDDKTIMFTMAKPYGQFFFGVLGTPILPKHIWKDHLTADGIVDVQWGTDPKATIGTGQYMYKEGVSNVYRLITRFEDFWGKTITTPAGASFWPAGVKEIYMKIYTNIDTAVLALESGEVDYIAWAVTAGKIPEVQANPNTQIYFMPDNGYFYLAFNEKKEPMNSLAFRQAVSHVIDKTTAVKTYMGGYGVAGDSCEPAFWKEAGWYNTSVEHQTYDLDTAKAILDAAGFTVGGDGLRKMPDGRAIPPITLLTPPADYDPIRIKIGTMIATNLQSIGLNVVAKPINFDTLVANMNSFNYQMLELGWSMTADPIGNVFDVLSPTGINNNFGFWSDTNPNPIYSDKKYGGVSTLADAPTQALADQVKALEEKAKTSFDIKEQIKYTKEAQGIISKAIPVNVLYYRVNAEGASKAWSGWTPFMGSLFNGNNIYSLANLKKTTGGPVSSGKISLLFNAPTKIILKEKETASVNVYNDKGDQLSGASVKVTTTSDNVTLSAATGSTSAQGAFSFDITGAKEGFATVSVEVTSGTNKASGSTQIQVFSTTLPKYLYLSATPGKYFLSAGQNTNIALEVKDETGKAVSGVTVTADKNQLKFGSIDKSSLTTDSSGKATLKYTAPATTMKNMHMNPTVALEATKAGYTYGSTVLVNLAVVNNGGSLWNHASITDVSRIAANATNPNVTINVSAGANEKLTVSYTNSSMLNSPVDNVTTDSGGNASLTVSFKALSKSAALRISFKNLNTPYATSDAVTLLYKGTTLPAGDLYGGTISFTARDIVPYGNLSITVNLRDINNAVPTGTIKAGIAVASTPDGALASIPGKTDFDSGYDYAGLIVNSAADETGISSAGLFGCDVDIGSIASMLESWYGVTMPAGSTRAAIWENWTANEYGDTSIAIPQSIDIANGVATFKIEGQATALLDYIDSVFVCPDAYATFDGANWFIVGNTTITSDFTLLRGADIITAKYSLTNSVINTIGTPSNTSVSVTAYDQTNAAVKDATINLYGNVGSKKVTNADPGTTDASGKATVIVSPKPTTSTLKPDLYIKASMAGYISVLQVTQIVINTAQMKLELSGSTHVEAAANTTVQITATATLADKSLLEGAEVAFTTSFGTVTAHGNASMETNTTDAAGKAVFDLNFKPTASDFASSSFFVISLNAKAQEPSTTATGNTFQLEVYATEPTVTITSPTGDQELTTESDNLDVVIQGTAADLKGVKEVWMKVDGGSWVKQNITAGASVNFAITKTLDASSDGKKHDISVRAVDGVNFSKDASVSFTVKKTGLDMTMIIGIVVVLLVVIFVAAAAMAMRKKGGKTPEKAEEEGEPAEEKEDSKPEEDKETEKEPEEKASPP